MTALRAGMRVMLIMVVAVLLLWTNVDAEHNIATFSQTNTTAGGTAIRGLATSGSFETHEPIGVLGRASASSGLTTGVRGEAASTHGRGVFGHATATSGVTQGVVGRAASTSGVGVFGWATAPSGTTHGVFGQSDSTTRNSAGVFGLTSANSGVVNGVVGQSNSRHGRGVYGAVNAFSGPSVGVQGDAISSDGIGVSGLASATTGEATGVFGMTSSGTGFGVRGINANVTRGVGVLGQSTSNRRLGIGVHGIGSGIGVIGEVPSTEFGSIGVLGRIESPSGNAVEGVSQFTQSSNGIGVSGTSFGDEGIGVRGEARATSGSTFGVFGSARSPLGIAVYGAGSNGARAARFDGRVDINCATTPCLFVNGGQVADLAEDIPAYGKVAPGDVVVLAPQGHGVIRTTRAYDTRVAGIVSGHPRVRFRVARWTGPVAPVAMVGVVKTKATAANGRIQPGDLLTTSRTPGHVMRCPVPVRCVGAIVGKAMEPLASGERQILVMLWRQ